MSKIVYRKTGRRSLPVLSILFAVLLFGFSAINLLAPKRTEIELVNRKAASFPSFSVKDLLNGKWQNAFSVWMQDQIAFRDGWVNLQRTADEFLFQKAEESDILLGKDGWQFTKQFTFPDAAAAQLAKNVTAVSEFSSRYPGKVTFLLAPSAAVIYPEYLPAGAPMIDENALLDQIFAQIGQTAQIIDLRDTFRACKDEYLFYKNDHHWTTHGAYRAYEQFCLLRGLVPFDESQSSVSVEDFYGTHWSATRRWNALPDTLVYYPLDAALTIYKLTGEAQFEAVSSGNLMNSDKLQSRDKYGAFLGGNNGYSVLEGRGQGSILIVKDSYANCFIPFLTDNYAKIGIVDFRGFAYGIDSTIEKEGYDEVLILYNFQTFVSDNKVIYINRPTTLQ